MGMGRGGILWLGSRRSSSWTHICPGPWGAGPLQPLDPGDLAYCKPLSLDPHGSMS